MILTLQVLEYLEEPFIQGSCGQMGKVVPVIEIVDSLHVHIFVEQTIVMQQTFILSLHIGLFRRCQVICSNMTVNTVLGFPIKDVDGWIIRNSWQWCMVQKAIQLDTSPSSSSNKRV